MTERLVLLQEPGARWELLALGPLVCVVAGVAGPAAGADVPWLGLVLCAVTAMLLAALWVRSRRRRGTVELTSAALRNGVEVLPLSQVAAVLPARDRAAGELSWESARVLGLAGVPRGRTAVGLRLADGVEVRAWARDSEWLRVLLCRELEGRKAKP